MIPWIIVGVLLIALVIGLIKSAGTWNWVPMVLLSLIFITAIFGVYHASKLYKARGAWIHRSEQNEILAEKAIEAADEVLYGPPDALAYGEESVLGTNGELNLLKIDQGRIWSGGEPAVNGQLITLTFPPDSSGVSLASQIRQDMHVYVFAEQGIDVGGKEMALPVRYVGTFQVQSVDVAANMATLKPLFVTSQSASEVATPTTTWSLHETMPRDSRSVFLEDLGMDIEERDITAYRNALRDRYLPAEMLGMDPASKEYEALLDQYAFDGLSMNVIQRWIDQQPDRINDLFDPDDIDRDVLLKFTSDSEPIAVDGTANPSEGRLGPGGLANDPGLHHGSDVTIRKDQEILLTKEYPLTGVNFPADAIVDYYRRPLRDYPYVLEELGRLSQRLREAIGDMKADIVVSDAIIADTTTQISHRTDLLAKLQSDLGMRQQELAILDQHRQQLESRLGESEQTIRTCYQQILELRKTLEPVEGLNDTSVRPIGEGLIGDARQGR